MSDAPSSWIQTTIAEVADILDNQRIPINGKEREERLSMSSSRYPYYGATGQVGEIDDFIFEGEAVLLGEDGAPFLEQSKAKAYLVSGKYWVNNHAHILRGNGSIENRFLCHQLNVLNYRQFVSGTTRLKLTQGSLKELPIKLPPIDEQNRIVDKIETLFTQLDQGEASLRTVQTLLTRYRQSVLKAAVTGQLTADWRAENAQRLEHGRDLLQRILQTRRDNWQGRGKYKEPAAPDTSDLPELPEGWVWASLDYLLKSFITGPFGSALHKSDYVTNGTPLINPINIVDGRIFPDSKKGIDVPTLERLHRYRVELGDIVIARRGDMGRCAAVTANETGWLCGTGSMILRPTTVVHPEFLSATIRSHIVVKHLDDHSVGTTMKNLNQRALLSAPIAIPTIEEQTAVVQAIDDAFRQIEQLSTWCESELTRSTALRQSILKDAFAGRLVPQDPNDEPASALLARIRAEREAATQAARPSRSKPAGRKAHSKQPQGSL